MNRNRNIGTLFEGIDVLLNSHCFSVAHFLINVFVALEIKLNFIFDIKY